ncbi:MAG: GNAT family N-acetyltransferase [Acidimicrobiia bacterium]|nr:GNAT family N-acetyltransferase [Acidimicrobiia bacterium]
MPACGAAARAPSCWSDRVPFDLQPTLTGERLTLRPLRPDDFGVLYAVASDPLISAPRPV